MLGVIYKEFCDNNHDWQQAISLFVPVCSPNIEDGLHVKNTCQFKELTKQDELCILCRQSMQIIPCPLYSSLFYSREN